MLFEVTKKREVRGREGEGGSASWSQMEGEEGGRASWSQMEGGEGGRASWSQMEGGEGGRASWSQMEGGEGVAGRRWIEGKGEGLFCPR